MFSFFIVFTISISLHSSVIATTYRGSVTTPINGSFRLNAGDTISTETNDTSLVMQPDGNLVLYDNNHYVLWTSITNNNAGSYALINLKGNIQIKSNSTDAILWESGTNNHTSSHPHSLHVAINCAYLIDKNNTLLWNAGPNCCILFPQHTSVLAPTTSQSDIFINNQCLPIDDISWVNNYQIAWIKVVSCTEDTNTFTYHYNKTIIFEQLASSTISVKIEPNNGTSNPDYDYFAITAIPYSNPVYALRNNVELSYLYDPNTSTIYGTAPDTSNWIGTCTAINRISGKCVNKDAPHSASDRLLHAACNQQGVHIFFGERCDWNYTDITGQDMDVYFGFELIECPTINPTQYPSQSPTKVPTKALSSTTDALSSTNDALSSTTDVLYSVEDDQHNQLVLFMVLSISGVIGCSVVTFCVFICYKRQREETQRLKKKYRMEVEKSANQTVLQRAQSASEVICNGGSDGVGNDCNRNMKLSDVRSEGLQNVINVETKRNIKEDEFEVIGDDETAGNYDTSVAQTIDVNEDGK